MALYKEITMTGNGASVQNSDPYVLDFRKADFNVSIIGNTDGSTTGWTVQYTVENPWATYATDFGTDADWFDLENFTDLLADADGNLTGVVTALRLQLDANGTDTVTVQIRQA